MQRNCTMASHTIGIIVNGATGRIGSTQHLANALIPIIAEGGLALGDDRLVPPLLREAQRRGVKHGVVEDKIHLPGLQKLSALTRSGALGRVVGFRLEFGWWVFDGSAQPCQRPSWNYRAGGGGIILD